MKSDENRWKSEKLVEIEHDGLASNRVEFRLIVVSVHDLQLVTVDLRECQAIARDVCKRTQLGCGKVEFCLTKLQALRATSSTFAQPHWIDVLNAFGLFASARRDRR
ncbi:MAG: hypothetical protein WBN15_17555 [Polyangiales bacterium]